MSVKQMVIQCDWPGCPHALAAEVYPGVLRDHLWSFRGDMVTGQHFCPSHRYKTEQDYLKALEEAAQSAGG